MSRMSLQATVSCSLITSRPIYSSGSYKGIKPREVKMREAKCKSQPQTGSNLAKLLPSGFCTGGISQQFRRSYLKASISQTPSELAHQAGSKGVIAIGNSSPSTVYSPLSSTCIYNPAPGQGRAPPGVCPFNYIYRLKCVPHRGHAFLCPFLMAS